MPATGAAIATHGNRLRPLVAAMLWLYVAMLPLAHWLAPSGWLPLPNIPLIGAATLCVLGRIGSLKLAWRDLVILGLVAVAVVSTIVSSDTLTSKSINHMVALLFVTVMNYFVGGRLLFSILKSTWRTPVLIGFLFSSFLCACEFVLVNFLDTPLPGYRPYGQGYDSTFLFGVRPRSTFYESSHFAFYLACMVPLLVAAYSDDGSRKTVKLVLGMFFICATLLFSTSLFLVIVLWGLIYFVMSRAIVRPIGLALLVLVGILVGIWWNEVVLLADVLVLHKFDLYSFDDRQEKFLAVLENLQESNAMEILFGHGMGSFEGLGMADSISAYANFLRDAGVVGLAFFIAMLIPLESVNARISRRWQAAFLYLGVALLMYFTAVPNYYFPHLAFSLGVMSSANDPASGLWAQRRANAGEP